MVDGSACTLNTTNTNRLKNCTLASAADSC